MKRILVIRGGAIGDFVLTLPAIKLLRRGFPEAQIEILGYKHIVALAENRFYAEATRSIEYGRLASFFARGAELPNELCGYFHGFDLIVSYLFDPDRIFEQNLMRAGAETFLACSSKIQSDGHAAEQLARPLSELGLKLSEPAAELFPNEDDRKSADHFLPKPARRLIALHPGSGSPSKNWSIENWTTLGQRLARNDRSAFLVLVGGEADASQITQLREQWSDLSASYVVNQPLTQVAAILARCDHFVGHDSGISHIAAAVDTRCTLLFGPSDPTVWGPRNRNVRLVRPSSQNLNDVSVEEIIAALKS